MRYRILFKNKRYEKEKITNVRRNITPQNQRMKAKKQTYSCLCEPVKKYINNLNKYGSGASLEWLKQQQTFSAYAQSDHSDIGEHYHVFDPIDLGEGFYAHIGMNWPQSAHIINTIVTMECEMDDEHGHLSLAPIYNVENQREELAFFTEQFRESWGDTTKYGMSMLFLKWAQCDHSIIGTISPSCEARWIFPEGVAIGRKQCGFYVFDEFTDVYKHPMRPLTDSDWDDIWNNY